jgi:hypothetical protein
MNKMEQVYICNGESYRNNIGGTRLAETHTLKEWIILLFGEAGISFFKNDSDKEILAYIKANAGKRLSLLNARTKEWYEDLY